MLARSLFLFMVMPWLIQTSAPIRGPITALRIDGDRLLIGQQDTLIEAQVTPSDVTIIRTIKLNRHGIRAFAVSQNITLVLSEDGITTLDANGNVLGFAQGGGQRIAVNGDRVYVAALAAGVRLLRLDPSGKLEPLGVLMTVGPAADVAAEADGLAWVAESDQGVRLYDLRNPANPITMVWLRDVAPASVLRVSGPRLYAGYGSHVAVINTLNLQSPKLLTTVALDGTQSTVGDLAIQGSHLYVGRVDKTGPDMLSFDISNLKAVPPGTPFGSDGAGERLVLSGSDLFLGSGRDGLRRVSLNSNTLIATWEAASVAENCTVSAPSDPQPANLSQVSPAAITLKWTAPCSPTAYEVRINGQLAATTHDSSYSFTPQHDVINWQVTAIDAAGKRADSPTWRFEVPSDGWLAGPAAPPNASPIYVPPPVLIDFHSPFVVILTTCAAMIVGLGLIVGMAWFIGSRAENRNLPRKLS